jgi:3-hydroxyacyl-[acyl-carrier-protein] dehydratase
MTRQCIALPIAADHPAYAGHFPGQPILPGVVLLDVAIHAIAEQLGLTAGGAQIRAAKFLSPVRPGEALQLHFGVTTNGIYACEIRVDARVVASCQVSFAHADAAGSTA